MCRPTVEIVELGELVGGEIQYFVALGDESRITELLARVHRNNSQIARQVVVVYVPDLLWGVVIKSESVLEQRDRGRQILLQNLLIRLGVARVFAVVPKVSCTQQGIEGGILRIEANGPRKFVFHLRNGTVVIAMIDSPESVDCHVCGRASRVAGR